MENENAALVEPEIIVYAARCGHHHNDDCHGCVHSLEWTNEMLDQLRAEKAALTTRLTEAEAEIEELTRKLGGGCDADPNGHHAMKQPGTNYWFCGKCGESLKGVRYCHMPGRALTEGNQSHD